MALIDTITIDATQIFDFVGAKQDVRDTNSERVELLITSCIDQAQRLTGRWFEAQEFSGVAFINGVNCSIIDNRLSFSGPYRDTYRIDSIVEEGVTLDAITSYNDGNDYYLDAGMGAILKIKGCWSTAPFGIIISGAYGYGGEVGSEAYRQIIIEMVAAKSGLWRQNVLTESGTIESIRTNISEETAGALKRMRLIDIF